MRLGMTVLRMTVGGLFVGHGTQKLFGWFGGSGPEGTGSAFARLGLHPGRQHALAAGAAEAGGGLLLATGFLTPLGAMLTTSTMATAIRLVHARRGVWNTEGGYEYNAVLIAAAFGVTAAGPGAFSLDALRGRKRWGDGWALAELAGGLAGSALAVELGQRLKRRAEERERVAAARAADAAADEQRDRRPVTLAA